MRSSWLSLRVRDRGPIAARLVAVWTAMLLVAGSGLGAQSAACGTITTVAGGGPEGTLGDGGSATQAKLHLPYGVAVGPGGNIYIADTYNYRIRQVDRDTGIITTVAGTGTFGFSGDGGPASSAKIDRPYTIDFDLEGRLYFTDTGNLRVRRIDHQTGKIATVVGNGGSIFAGDGAPATSATLGPAYGLAFDPSGTLYVADTGHDRIRRVDPASGIITTVVGTGALLFPLAGDDGPADEASLSIPFSLAFDQVGNMFISDSGNGRIRRVDRDTGEITTVAGIGPVEASLIGQAVSSVPVPIPGAGAALGDGGPGRRAILAKLRAIITDPAGNVYFADSAASRVWRLDADTGTITSIAGTGSDGFAGDGGPAYKATLSEPLGLSMDAEGNLYIADTANSRIRRVTPPFCSEEFPPLPPVPPAPA